MIFGLPLALVDKLMGNLVTFKNEVIAELREQNARLTRENERLRQRADLAVDALLAAQHRPSIMPERNHLPSAEEKAAAAERARVMADLKSELEKVGDTGSSPEDPIDGHARTHVEEIQ